MYEMNEQILDNLVVDWYFLYVQKWFAKESDTYLPQFQDEFLTQFKFGPITQIRVWTSVNLLPTPGLVFAPKNLHK